MDQSRAPYFEALRAYAEVDRNVFHVPGHIQGKGSHPLLIDALGLGTLQLDLCSGLPGLDGRPGSALEEAEALAAAVYGAERSWFLINGSTSGNQIMVSSVCHPGEVILTPRNTHKSIISALVVSGARPVYITPEIDPRSHIAHGVTPAAVEAGLRDHPEAKAVLIVCPTYYGACSDVAAIAEVVHRHGIPLLVDEAWGPHFPFHPELPPPALTLGADASVTGTHKLAGALTQSAMLHVRGPLLDQERIDVVSKMLLSTSPSCLFYASLDVARMQMATAGEELLQETLRLAEEARTAIWAHPRLSCIDKTLVGSHAVVAFDPTRLCVNVTRTGHTGYEVERLLCDDHGVMAEMSDFANVLFNFTIGHRQDDVDHLLDALMTVADQSPHRVDPHGFIEFGLATVPEQVLSPSEAFHAPQRRVPLAESAGCLSAELAASYPPGIPVVVPGERLTPPLVDYLLAQVAAGCRIVGSRDHLLRTIQVVIE